MVQAVRQQLAQCGFVGLCKPVVGMPSRKFRESALDSVGFLIVQSHPRTPDDPARERGNEKRRTALRRQRRRGPYPSHQDKIAPDEWRKLTRRAIGVCPILHNSTDMSN